MVMKLRLVQIQLINMHKRWSNVYPIIHAISNKRSDFI